MKKAIATVLYLAVCALQIYACVPPAKTRLRILTKPLLMPLLALCLILSAKSVPYLIVLGLIAGFIGDVLLIRTIVTRTAFITGSCFFVLGHLLYAAWFIRGALPLAGIVSVIVPAACVYAALLFLWMRKLSDRVGKGMWRCIPVYFGVIFLMSLSSLAFALTNGGTAWICWAGSLLFLLSDGILTYNKFIEKLRLRDVLVMSTYILAQTGIALGAVLHIGLR